MRLKKIKNAKEIVQKSSYYVENPLEIKGKWNTMFEKNQPIHIEIGMGKGKSHKSRHHHLFFRL